MRRSVPLLIHRVWFGNDSPPYSEFWEKWRQLYPGWGLVTWQNPYDLLRDHFLPRPLERQLTSDIRVLSDVARLEILHRVGGVYVDCDIEPLTSGLRYATLHEFVGEEEPGIYCNAVMGARPGSPWVGAMLEDLDRSLKEETITSYRSGPWFVTGWVRRMGIKVYPPEVFYPVHYNGTGEITDKSITNHHWASNVRA